MGGAWWSSGESQSPATGQAWQGGTWGSEGIPVPRAWAWGSEGTSLPGVSRPLLEGTQGRDSETGLLIPLLFHLHILTRPIQMWTSDVRGLTPVWYGGWRKSNCTVWHTQTHQYHDSALAYRPGQVKTSLVFIVISQAPVTSTFFFLS